MLNKQIKIGKAGKCPVGDLSVGLLSVYVCMYVFSSLKSDTKSKLINKNNKNINIANKKS